MICQARSRPVTEAAGLNYKSISGHSVARSRHQFQTIPTSWSLVTTLEHLVRTSIHVLLFPFVVIWRKKTISKASKVYLTRVVCIVCCFFSSRLCQVQTATRPLSTIYLRASLPSILQQLPIVLQPRIAALLEPHYPGTCHSVWSSIYMTLFCLDG